MWVKKYAPTQFDDIVGNEDIVERFKTMCKTKYVQHMILCGPSGVGKASLLDIMMRNILGDQYSDGVIMFTSSDNKSNQHVRDKIHQFVPTKLCKNVNKFIVFKQAELLSEGVQQVMRYLMEAHYHHAVFVFVCNKLGNLLETIQSRCHIYNFQSIAPHIQVDHLKRIKQKEGLDHAIDEVVFTKLTELSGGDMRTCINYFQVYCASLSNIHREHTSVEHPSVADTDICTTCLFPYYDNIKDYFDTLACTDQPHMVSFFKAIECLKHLDSKGYCGQDIVIFLNNYLLVQEKHLPRELVLEWLKDIALCHARMTNGVDNFVQLCGLVANMFRHMLLHQTA